MEDETPGGALGGRPLAFILICDCSSSMSGEKIGSLNFAIRSAIPKMQDEARNNHNAQVLVRVITFSSGAQWHVSQPTPIETFTWTDMQANGVTDMGHALSLLADQLQPSRMPKRGLPPVLVLLSDGHPTDDFNAGLNALMAQPWGQRAVRIAIAIGHDAKKDVLKKFMGHPELEPLEANNPDQLVKLIQWASTVVLGSVVKPPTTSSSQTATSNATQVAMHTAPPTSGDAVW